MNNPTPFQFKPLQQENQQPAPANFERLQDILLPIQFVVATAEKTMQGAEFFQKGTIIETSYEADTPIDILVGGKKVAQAIMLVDSENKLIFKVI